MTELYENGYTESDSLFEALPDGEEPALGRERCFSLNDLLEICAELWSKRHCLSRLEVLADKLFYVDKREMTGLLGFLYDRFSGGAYTDDPCTAALEYGKPDGRLYVTLASRSGGQIARLCFERREFIMPETVGDAVECEMLREDIGNWLAKHEGKQ